MKNRAMILIEQEERSVKAFRARFLQPLLDAGQAGRWALMDGEELQGTYSTERDANTASRQGPMNQPFAFPILDIPETS